MDPHKHDERMADLARMRVHADALLEKVEQLRARPEEPPPVAQGPPPRPLDPKDFDTTIAQVRRMAEKDLHPTWMHAAYADLAGRLARVEDRLDEMADSLRMILGQLAALERQDREP